MTSDQRLVSVLAWAQAEINKHEAYAADFETRARSPETFGAMAMAGEHRACARTLKALIAADKTRVADAAAAAASPYIIADLRRLLADRTIFDDHRSRVEARIAQLQKNHS